MGETGTETAASDTVRSASVPHPRYVAGGLAVPPVRLWLCCLQGFAFPGVPTGAAVCCNRKPLLDSVSLSANRRALMTALETSYTHFWELII